MAAALYGTKNTDVYRYLLPFEESFDREQTIDYLAKIPWFLPFILVACYITLVFAGQRYMKHRKPFKLRGIMFTWNSILALSSGLMAVRYSNQLAYTVHHFGLHHSVCGPWHQDTSPVGYFWQLIFSATKVVELADSAFIVLRKQPLYFLHWYHHSTVLLYVWYSFMEQSPSGRWFGIVNSCIHIVMYSYYALKSISVRVPRNVAMAITVSQLLQMVMGCYLSYYMYQAKQHRFSCTVSDNNLLYSMLMYLSYFFLFLWYFYRSYFCSSSSSAKRKVLSDKKSD